MNPDIDRCSFADLMRSVQYIFCARCNLVHLKYSIFLPGAITYKQTQIHLLFKLLLFVSIKLEQISFFKRRLAAKWMVCVHSISKY